MELSACGWSEDGALPSTNNGDTDKTFTYLTEFEAVKLQVIL